MGAAATLFPIFPPFFFSFQRFEQQYETRVIFPLSYVPLEIFGTGSEGLAVILLN
jgi:hypothetical protein